MKVVVYVTGGIAAYKAVNVVRLLQKNGHEVRVAMTDAAQKFVSTTTFAALLKEKVVTDLFIQGEIPHIELADWADVSLVVPATANILAKMAQGIADDLVSTALLATATMKLVVPAMNTKMWTNPATQRNIALLKKDGVRVLTPVSGPLAEGYAGKGRMPEPEAIWKWFCEQVNKVDGNLPLAGRKVVISAGATSEPIDPVRYITNRSSGKMGAALAQVATMLGAETVVVAGQMQVALPTTVRRVDVTTVAEMNQALNQEYITADIVIMAAAVADYRVAEVAPQKIKKQAEMVLKLQKNIDILANLGARKQHQFLVGFAAETENLVANAQQKMERKNADLIVANDVSRRDIGFNSEQNEVQILRRQKPPRVVAKADKIEVAKEIFKVIIEDGNFNTTD
ncbi:bifunctional phosphopantothenoylcysteine decarboxylase/phosphopantothenate--cysteine ligase CoaBC [Ligilactobacillus saerimneri]|uniref:bifunctional phosphopantothenoylcysteine decarboxylase/phosphopantothenate--cysteine ligase CoaBC n=1 Tax=Ligilactobacillus saerimneri TaxID=228229 RepID=UPI001C10B989|nr:bifunctional phosphopantothenoylcysteine decarboxylase/phosphopantothenate--cysteine ligase CoaBC [Ligilactobacillus saerimneri]MBU5308969.1 bifunctional phosphopantothenoylcysteine decarboxylase/phosphopantothenate--cysteine ligase CoaBC [Ligilactobacillus saerimneri]